MEAPALWRVLEFYSGIGGMVVLSTLALFPDSPHDLSNLAAARVSAPYSFCSQRYSLMALGARAEVVEAFDINDVANDVYEHNFGHRPCQGNIQTLTASDLDKYKAHAWLLSPPCQPYTRQGLQKHSADARAFSFIKILNLMQNMSYPPQMLFVENVVGFEVSDTHDQLLEVLSSLNFNLQEFILSPLQFGVPYSRPRYFCLAKREPMRFQNASFNNKLLRKPMCLSQTMDSTSQDGDHRTEEELDPVCKPVKDFLVKEADGAMEAFRTK
ncbi:hypothetical protein PVAP13_5NG312300 [Panicum virgatum]|uniref:Uncharacterized protein n=1 Tax=Panicum virgatum TaxID=38727 RepID=A0A8T0RZP0_PANVG|nr:hypothetical protein PVAP13_5NG312300 [Panicum virgatum]